MDRWMDKWTYGQTDGWMDGQRDGQQDGWLEKYGLSNFVSAMIALIAKQVLRD